MIPVGSRVIETKGYAYAGTVMAGYKVSTGEVRYDVKLDFFDMLHIFSESQIRIATEEEICEMFRKALTQAEERLNAVRKEGCALRYVQNKTPEICLEAVKQELCALRYVEEGMFLQEKDESAPRCVQCHSECPYGLKKYPELIICHNPECPCYGLCQAGNRAMDEINKMAI